MNILISLPYFPLENTGTGNSVYGLSKGLIAAGANVTVLAESEKFEILKYKEVPYIEFSKEKSKNPFKVSRQLLSYLRDNKNSIDLLILNGIFVPYVYTLSKFANDIGLPYIHIPHGVYNDVAFVKSRFKKLVYFKFFESKVIDGALAVQMLSHSQYSALKAKAKPKNIISFPHGVDSSLLVCAKTVDSGERDPSKIKIIFWGRKDIYIKGLDLLVKAFSNIDDSNVELHIQGLDIGETEELINLISRLKISNITLKEKYTGNPLDVLKKYDFMIMPSRLEAFSMAVVEGMLAGLPIVVSEEVGAAEYVELAGAGILCRPDEDSIRQAIEKMLKMHKEWGKLGEKGRNYMIEQLSWETIGKKVLKKYKELLNA
ncbi:glycosyltransferase [Francisellaceae bacterium]|nr:glycosyltransferase [Francisellaceae bacterium]